MIKTLFAKSGLATALTSEQLYFVTDAANKGALLGIYADETNDQVKLYFKDNGNTAANEVLTLDSENGKAETAAEAIIDAINGLLKNAQVVKVSDGIDSVNGIDGVDLPAFTVANTDVAITATATDDFTFTLGSATVGCTFFATLGMDEDCHDLMKSEETATA